MMLSKMTFSKRRSNSTTSLLKLLLYFPIIFHIRPNPFIAWAPLPSLISFHWSALCTLWVPSHRAFSMSGMYEGSLVTEPSKMLFDLPESPPAPQPWCTLVQPMDLNSIMTLKSLLPHPVFGDGGVPCIGSHRICLLFIIRLVSVKAATVCLLLSAFYVQKLITCLRAHSRCSICIQCVKDREVLGSLNFSLGSALLISLYLCRFNSSLSSVDVHTTFKAQSKA